MLFSFSTNITGIGFAGLLTLAFGMDTLGTVSATGSDAFALDLPGNLVVWDWALKDVSPLDVRLLPTLELHV